MDLRNKLVNSPLKIDCFPPSLGDPTQNRQGAPSSCVTAIPASCQALSS